MALDLCKYYKKQRFVSYDNGQTWQPLDEYEKGELYEAHSASCGAGVFQYRWVLINDGYICDGKNRYAREIYQYSEDGTVWYNVFPTIYRKGALVESNSPFCDNAGNGQYTSGDTEPISGETPCPEGYGWNGYACVCSSGESFGGDCIICYDHTHWDGITHKCECNFWWKETSRIDEYHPSCIYVDPLKNIKCDGDKYKLTSEDVNYYENGWAVVTYTIGDCITEIDSGAFNGQVYMTNVTIPSSVEDVGNYAFANCRSLTTINFPNDITNFGYGVFSKCENLRNVTFGGSTPTSLSPYLFSNCISLESATWLQYNNITSIGANTFYNCYSLNNVILPNTLQTIGENAFYSNYSIENITIPSGVTSIGYNAFSNCTGMTFANINSDNISIGNSAFNGNTSLTAVTIDSSGITMGSNVFSGCTRLLKLTFTATVPPTIESGDFDNTNNCTIFVPCESEQAYKTAWSEYADRISCDDTGVYYRWVDDPSGVYCDGTDQYTRQKQQSTTNGITWTDTGVYRPITLITHYSEECGYQGEVALTVTNEDGFTRYYEPCDSQPPQPSENSKIFATYAYGNIEEKLCDGSTTLTSGDTNMSGDTYSKQTMINSIIGSCVTTIGENAFWDCHSLTSVTIPNSVTNIGRYAFYRCESLKNIDIPSGVTTIGDYAFENCSGLTSVTIPDTVTSIGNSAFESCSGLTSITIPDSVTSIAEWAFSQCRSLTSCTIGDGVTYIGDYTFGWCSSLTSVTIGSGVTNISPYAFYNCSSLPIDGYIKYAGTIAVEATDKTQSSYIFKQGTRLIGYGIFQDCSSLSSVTIPNSVTSIDNYAFQYCTSLTSITIPDSVTSIGNSAFAFCSGLTSVICNATTPPTLGKDAFKRTNDCPIYVPAESVNAYKSAWSAYSSRIQAIPNS